MTPQPRAIFVLNLVQDVNILRPLVHMAVQSFAFEAVILISPQFAGRDRLGIWHSEIDALCAETGASQHVFANEHEAFAHLVGTGVIFAGSESGLPAHVTTHNIFRIAPPGFLKVTLQHGFECIGLRHSAEHVLAHGSTAAFGADLVCAWQPTNRLTALSPSQAGKIILTGPTASLQMPTGAVERRADDPGIVCENLHSVRLRMAGDFKTQFADAFATFCARMAGSGEKVALRPHPGGQYMLRNKLKVPPNAILKNAPMYRLDLRQFSYGLSAPSSVLIDMMLADIPTAVWIDREGAMDGSSYAGIATVSGPDDWFDFARAAQQDPQPFIAGQRDFLAQTGMPLDPQDVFRRFADVFVAARRLGEANRASGRERARILFVANSNVPTLQLSFEKPLAALVARGEIVTRLLTEPEIRTALAQEGEPAVALHRSLVAFDPDMIVFCRYSGPGTPQMLEWAQANAISVMFHIDDDLLAIPKDIGEGKHALHNAPERIEAVRLLLGQADLVYVSTEALLARLAEAVPGARMQSGRIYCSGSIIRRPPLAVANSAICKVGYMASADHAHNLTMILPAIEALLDRNPGVQFEFFGSIAMPPELARFGDRITAAPPVANYARFLEEFAAREWDIGICPLSPIPFNLMKANTKWVEYTSVGAAVVASRGGVYDACCADGAGLLADTPDEWLAALERLVRDGSFRLAQVARAQTLLQEQYGLASLRAQVLDMIALCRAQARERVAHPQLMESN